MLLPLENYKMFEETLQIILYSWRKWNIDFSQMKLFSWNNTVSNYEKNWKRNHFQAPSMMFLVNWLCSLEFLTSELHCLTCCHQGAAGILVWYSKTLDLRPQYISIIPSYAHTHVYTHTHIYKTLLISTSIKFKGHL